MKYTTPATKDAELKYHYLKTKFFVSSISLRETLI